ncbi:hypothetical protein [Streptomyces rubradiris]|uniref:Uncharacterized protein n=1 Tax=Streptomyces rubradiris TaxID=285531 RepID=A0ABQ3RDP8_STRRR|nr:hypothetical protein [Streptomyces rubradiris]GHH29531.1 hypothetical protein GCM10018792_74760 [Streptomyces rubradiris]GHI53964.1 hypothetical protein Srubr_38100 [Streptomyces rubradiris]
MADAQITLTYSRNIGVVAIATGKHYESAEKVLGATGFRRGEAGTYHVSDADEAAAKKALARLVQRAQASGIEVTASSRRFIGDAARDIARLLPGQWNTQVEIYAHPVWQEDLLPYLWDNGDLAHAVRTARIPYAATLTNRATATILLLAERPGRLGYLVGALAPAAFGEVDGDPHAPRSITVGPFPGPAAQAITERYLPAYEQAVHERRITMVAEALGIIQSELDPRREPRTATGAEGALPEQSRQCAPAGDAFLDRAWREFLTVVDHAPVLLDRCRPAASAWPQDAEALDQLAAALLAAEQVRDDLTRGVPLSRADHHQRTWPVIATWLTHSDSFLRQARAAAPSPPPAPALPAPPPRALPAHRL